MSDVRQEAVGSNPIIPATILGYFMKVDWKAVAKSEGYRSLKYALLGPERHKRMNREAYFKTFKRVIALAKNHACRRGVTIDVVLDEWEYDRNYNAHSYYNGISKIFTEKQLKNKAKPLSIEKSIQRYWWGDNTTKLPRIRELRTREAMTRREQSGKKQRWSAAKKRRNKW